MRRPRILNTDISGCCNLTCPSCPRGRRMAGGPTGFMDFDTWVCIVTKAQREFPVALIDFENWGEPTLNPDAPRMFAYCRDHNIPFRVSTNLQELNEGIVAAVECGAQLIWVSCSGFSQETYGRTHRGGFATLRSNMHSLVDARFWSKSKTRLILRWHRYKHNCHEERWARAFAKDHGYEFEPHIAWYLPIQRLIDNPEDEVTKLLLVPIEEGLRAVQNDPAPTECPEMDSLHVDANGQVKLCCLTYNLNVGEFLTTPLAELDWNKHHHKFCRLCSEVNAYRWLTKTSPKLLRIAMRNATTWDVKARLFGEMVAYSVLGLGRRIPLPYYLKSNISMWVKRWV